MTFLHIVHPNNKIYIPTRLHGVARAEDNAEMRSNLRIIVACLLAHWHDDVKPDLSGPVGELFDVVTTEEFYTKGMLKTYKGEDTVSILDHSSTVYIDERLWFCTYVGFEKVTSQWAKENAKGCHGVVTMRLHNQDKRHVELDGHTIQLYF